MDLVRSMKGVLVCWFIVEDKCETPKIPTCPRVEDEVMELDPVWLGLSTVSLSSLSDETCPFTRRLPSRADAYIRRRNANKRKRVRTSASAQGGKATTGDKGVKHTIRSCYVLFTQWKKVKVLKIR